jgi:hypothetical protein
VNAAQDEGGSVIGGKREVENTPRVGNGFWDKSRDVWRSIVYSHFVVPRSDLVWNNLLEWCNKLIENAFLLRQLIPDGSSVLHL